MPNQCDDCKANPVDIARKTEGTPTAKLIAILEAHGITNASELAEIVGISDRAVRKARNHSSGTTVPGGTTGPELQDRSGTTVPKTEPQFRNHSSALACAGNTTGATKESFQDSTYLEVKNNNIIDACALWKQLLAASGEALSRTSLNLENVYEPESWIKQGADLDRDVLPVVRALSSKARSGTIVSWKFFAQAVSNAVAARNAGLPPPAGIVPSADVLPFKVTTAMHLKPKLDEVANA